MRIDTPVPIEHHPLQPFLPERARILFLGSFPPKKNRWSMEFFYPNFQNDMWRIWGTLLYGEPTYFEVSGEKKFDYARVTRFCSTFGLAFYDTACAVRRLQDNASDKFLEVVEKTDLPLLLAKIPLCRTIVTTGEKATDVIVETYGCSKPPVGGFVSVEIAGIFYDFYRMPSSSRAYPLALAKKADAYRILMKYLE